MAPFEKLPVKIGNFPYYLKPAPIRGYFELEDVSERAQVCSDEKKTGSDDKKLPNQTSDMAEPRVRLSRHQGQLNFGPECMFVLILFVCFLL
jgi:hypothetical protein